MKLSTPDLHLLDDVVAERILEAMHRASKALTQAGVRHAVCGGLAVGAHGHPRATKDVDFLVGDEAFIVHSGGFVTMSPGVPIQIDGVAIDHLSAKPDEPFLAKALVEAVETVGVRVIPVEALVYMKLRAHRLRDRSDVAELVHAGLDTAACEQWLLTNAPDLCAKFRAIVAEAHAEE